ncbi:hypothetical protein ZWY2020_025288 [Hordeum vulgare]|nr:hypothetical protein ZWY2020_025288 [Hordeum vulgare]
MVVVAVGVVAAPEGTGVGVVPEPPATYPKAHRRRRVSRAPSPIRLINRLHALSAKRKHESDAVDRHHPSGRGSWGKKVSRAGGGKEWRTVTMDGWVLTDGVDHGDDEFVPRLRQWVNRRRRRWSTGIDRRQWRSLSDGDGWMGRGGRLACHVSTGEAACPTPASGARARTL